jgi:hypothetical protein
MPVLIRRAEGSCLPATRARRRRAPLQRPLEPHDELDAQAICDAEEHLDGDVLLALLDAGVVHGVHADRLRHLGARDAEGAPKASQVLAEQGESLQGAGVDLGGHVDDVTPCVRPPEEVTYDL